VANDLVSGLDWFPTLLAAAGEPPHFLRHDATLRAKVRHLPCSYEQQAIGAPIKGWDEIAPFPVHD
jgi:arylsulfatase A-like enzyme